MKKWEKEKKKNTSKMASLKDFTSHSALLFKKKKKDLAYKRKQFKLIKWKSRLSVSNNYFLWFFFLIEISKRTLKGLNSERGRKRKNKLLEVTDMQSADTSGNSLIDSWYGRGYTQNNHIRTWG